MACSSRSSSSSAVSRPSPADTRSNSTTRSLSSCEARSSLRAISPPGSDSAMKQTVLQRHAPHHAHRAAACCARDAAWLARSLRGLRGPPWNRTPGGQEAEVWIRLSASPRRPGLAVVRQPAPGDFGPYLGGQKVRDAVSGLGRVLPLGYAGDARAGTERDMARVLGASPAARSGLARTIAAVLDRDRASVAALRAGLTARRD